MMGDSERNRQIKITAFYLSKSLHKDNKRGKPILKITATVTQIHEDGRGK